MLSLIRVPAALALALVFAVSRASAASDRSLVATVNSIPAPGSPGAMGSSLVSSTEGEHWLSWLEPLAAGQQALKCARFNVARSEWDEARLIAKGSGWFVNWADFPVLAVQKGRVTAVWFVTSPGAGGHHGESYHAEFSISGDAGVTWSAPQPVTRESDSVEFVALQPLANGGLLAAWLDGRARKSGKDRQTLYARVIGETGGDTLVDDSVCDCCQLSFVSAGDGALLAYRGRSMEEIRDMRVARYRDGRWEKPQALHADGWKIAGCPVNGPQLAASDSGVAAAWFTAANNTPRVLASRLDAKTAKFGKPVVVDLGRPLGRVDTAQLPDGRTLVMWLESAADGKTGGVYLRSVSRDGALSEPTLLAPTSTARASGFPRMTLLNATAPVRLLLSYTQEGSPSRVVTTLVTLP